MNRNNETVGKGVKLFAFIFVLFVMLLFIFGAYTCFPVKKTELIASYTMEEFQNKARSSHRIFELKPQDYSVIGSYDTSSFIDRFTWKSHDLTFCNIMVHPESGAPYVMAVRVEEEIEALSNNETVPLRGMISNLNEEQSKRQEASLQGMKEYNSHLCMNTETDSVLFSGVKFVVFIILSIGCILLLIRMMQRSRALRVTDGPLN